MDPKNSPERLRELPSWLINQASLHANRVVGERLRGAHVAHRYHYSLLAALAESGPTSQADLGRRIGLDRSDVTATVNQMEQRGLLARHPDPADRRRNLVSLTDEGRRHLAQLDGVIGAAQEDLLAPLSTQERAELVRLLKLLAAHHTAC